MPSSHPQLRSLRRAHVKPLSTAVSSPQMSGGVAAPRRTRHLQHREAPVLLFTEKSKLKWEEPRYAGLVAFIAAEGAVEADPTEARAPRP